MATNVDIESNTYEFTLGYNKEDSFNILTFGNIGFLLHNAEDSFVYSFGLDCEHYFTDTTGVSARAGYRHTRDGAINNGGIMLQLGVPFSWSYGKITPYAGVALYDAPKYNLGVSFALRNQALAITLLTLGSFKKEWNETGTTRTRDYEKERQNRENSAIAINGVMQTTVEDKLPYPAWKWRPEYEGIYWEYTE